MKETREKNENKTQKGSKEQNENKVVEENAKYVQNLDI